MLHLAVLHQGALGDFLLALPVFDGLYRTNNSIRIDLCSKTEHIALIRSKPCIGLLHSAEASDLTPFYHDDLWANAPLPRFLENKDAVFVFGQKGSRVLAERLSRRLNAPVLWLQSFPDPGRLLPVSEFLAEQVRRAGWILDDVLPHIDPSPEEVSSVRVWMLQRGWSEGSRPVCVHPGSGGRGKVWPLQQWLELFRWLCEECRVPVVMTLGPADEYLEGLAAEAIKLGVEVVQGVTLPYLAALLSQSCFYVGNDSGVTHLAAAVGASVIAIFGPTPPEVWAPRGPNAHVVKSSWNAPDNLALVPGPKPAPLNPEIKSLALSLLLRCE